MLRRVAAYCPAFKAANAFGVGCLPRFSYEVYVTATCHDVGMISPSPLR